MSLLVFILCWYSQSSYVRYKNIIAFYKSRVKPFLKKKTGRHKRDGGRCGVYMSSSLLTGSANGMAIRGKNYILMAMKEFCTI